MHCPSCGTQASAEQKFCRTCGMDLQTVAPMVSKHLQEADVVPQPMDEETDRLRRMYRWMFSGMVAVIIGMGLIAASKEFSAPVGLIGVFIALAGTLFALYGIFSPFLFSKHQLSKQPKVPKTKTTSKMQLGSHAEPASSIVEETTRSLETVRAKTED